MSSSSQSSTYPSVDVENSGFNPMPSSSTGGTSNTNEDVEPRRIGSASSEALSSGSERRPSRRRSSDTNHTIFSPILLRPVPFRPVEFVLPYRSSETQFNRYRDHFPRLLLVNGMCNDDPAADFTNLVVILEAYALRLARDKYARVACRGVHPYVSHYFSQLHCSENSADAIVCGLKDASSAVRTLKPTIFVAPFLTSVHSYAYDGKIRYSLSWVDDRLTSTIDGVQMTQYVCDVQSELDSGKYYINAWPYYLERVASLPSCHLHIFHASRFTKDFTIMRPSFDDVMSNSSYYQDVTQEFTPFFQSSELLSERIYLTHAYSLGKSVLFGGPFGRHVAICKRAVQLASLRFAASLRNATTLKAIISELPAFHRQCSTPQPAVDALYVEACLVWSSPFGIAAEHLQGHLASSSRASERHNDFLSQPIRPYGERVAAAVKGVLFQKKDSVPKPRAFRVEEDVTRVQNIYDGNRVFNYSLLDHELHYLAQRFIQRCQEQRNTHFSRPLTHFDYLVFSDHHSYGRMKSLLEHMQPICMANGRLKQNPINMVTRTVFSYTALENPLLLIGSQDFVIFNDAHSAYFFSTNFHGSFVQSLSMDVSTNPVSILNACRGAAHVALGLPGGCEQCSDMSPAVSPSVLIRRPRLSHSKLAFEATQAPEFCLDHSTWRTSVLYKPSLKKLKTFTPNTVTYLFGDWMHTFYRPYLPCRCTPCLTRAAHKRILEPVSESTITDSDSRNASWVNIRMRYVSNCGLLFDKIASQDGFMPFSRDEFGKWYHEMLSRMTKNRAEQARRVNRQLRLYTPTHIYVTPIREPALEGHAKVETLMAFEPRDGVLYQIPKTVRLYSSLGANYSKLMPFFYYVDHHQFEYFTNRNPDDIYSLKGLNGLEKGDLFRTMVDQYDSYFTIDGSSFDARTGNILSVITQAFYSRFGAHPSFVDTIGYLNSSPMEYNAFTLNAHAPFNHSGMPNTSSVNFLVNYLFIFDLRHSFNTKMSAFIEGDDVTIFYDSDYVPLDDLKACVQSRACDIGMKYTIDSHGPIESATFCSGMFYPIGRRQYVWSVILPTHLLGFTVVPSSKVTMPHDEYRAALLYSLRALFWFIPGLSTVIEEFVGQDTPALTGDWWLDQQVASMDNIQHTFVDKDVIDAFLRSSFDTDACSITHFVWSLCYRQWDECSFIITPMLSRLFGVHSFQPLNNDGHSCHDHHVQIYRAREVYSDRASAAIRAVCGCIAARR